MEKIYLTRHDNELKLEDFVSINTSSECNSFCQKARKNKESVCSKCYVRRCENRFKNIHENLKKNSMILSRGLITDEQLDSIFMNRLYVRFNSFGELINRNHYKNLIAICKKFPKITFGLWTKRPNLVKGIEKPENLILIYSSFRFNEIEPLPSGFDKVFTVFTKEHAKKHKVKINCEKKCITCLKCYSHNGITNINELAK